VNVYSVMYGSSTEPWFIVSNSYSGAERIITQSGILKSEHINSIEYLGPVKYFYHTPNEEEIRKEE